MRKKVIAALLGTAALVTLAAPTPASAATNNQRFSVIARFNADDSGTCQVIAVGPISGVGTCEIEDISESVAILHLMFPNGTVDLRLKTVSETDEFNEGACIAKFTFQETWRIVGGTGAFAGVSGRGTDSGSGVFVLGRNAQGGCDESQGSGVVSATIVGRIRGGSAAA